MNDYPEEAMRALADFIIASDKCANEPDETFGAAFIAMEPLRERVNQYFTLSEFTAIIINMNEIREILRDAGLIGGTA